MTTDVVTLDADADLRAVLPIFRTHACRRVPLISDGQVVGMLTADDLLIDLIADLGDIARPITGEVIFGHHDAELPDAPGTMTSTPTSSSTSSAIAEHGRDDHGRTGRLRRVARSRR